MHASVEEFGRVAGYQYCAWHVVVSAGSFLEAGRCLQSSGCFHKIFPPCCVWAMQNYAFRLAELGKSKAEAG